MRLLVLLLTLVTTPAWAAYVNYLDSSGAPKPAPLNVPFPSEPGASNKYYVDFTHGTGSTCSLGSPCGDITSVIGKAGTTGGPAFIYVKGNGYLNLITGSLFGGVGTELVIKPWPGDSTPAVLTAVGGCTRPNANTISASGVHDIIVDGGPNMLVRFVGSGCTTDQNGYTLVVSSNNITLWRVRINANNSSGPALGPAVGSGTAQANFKLINSEVYGASLYYGVYGGGGTSCGAGDTSFTNMQFLNNVFHDIDGRGIQVEPRAASDGLIVAGNMFHNVGYDRSGNSGGPSDSIQPAGSCGGLTNHILIFNNISWDAGGGIVRIDYAGVGGASTFQIYNNTLWDYAKSSDAATTSSHGIGLFSGIASSPSAAEIENNIIIGNNQPGTVCGIDCSGVTKTTTLDNLCESGSGGCGTSSITASAAATWASTTVSSQQFLKLKSGSPAVDAGVTNTVAAIDYRGYTRPAGSAFDVGANEFGSSGSPPSVPANPR